MRQYQQHTFAFTKHNTLDLDIHKESQIQADAKEMSMSVSQVNQIQLMSIYIDFWLHTGTLASTQNLKWVSKSKTKRKYFINIRNDFPKSLRSPLSLRQVWLAQTFRTSAPWRVTALITQRDKLAASSSLYWCVCPVASYFLCTWHLHFIPHCKLSSVVHIKTQLLETSCPLFLRLLVL